MLDKIRELNPFRPNAVVDEIKELVRNHSQRQKAFDRWYKLLSQEDELAQPNMESFVGNDPRTTWNMATFLLQPKPMVIKIIPNSGNVIAPEARAVVEHIQQHFNSVWTRLNTKNLKRGKETWFWNFIGLLVATGWYAVPNWMEDDGELGIDYWNPAQVYPEFSDIPEEGLLRLARVRTITGAQAESNIRKNSGDGWVWPLGRHMPNKPVESHLYTRIDGIPVHAVVIDNIVVKPLTVIGTDVIPILAGAVAGIPKFDSIQRDISDTMGQSVLAPNEQLFRSLNKLQSFLMQLIRDTANPRVLEKSVSNNRLIKDPEDWYRRGAMFRGGPQDSIEVIAMPPIPVEVSQVLFGHRNAIQRGGFSDLTFGNIIGEVSAALVTQAAEAAMQLITPYKDVVVHVATESTNSWYHRYLDNPGIRPSSWPEIPDEVLELLKDSYIEASYAIKIPGDLNNRIVMAKQLNKNFELPVVDLITLLIPEVSNPAEAMSKLAAERAKLEPSYATVQLIQAYEVLAAEANAASNPSAAQLFTILSEGLRKQLTGQPTIDDRLGPDETVDARLGGA